MQYVKVQDIKVGDVFLADGGWSEPWARWNGVRAVLVKATRFIRDSASLNTVQIDGALWYAQDRESPNFRFQVTPDSFVARLDKEPLERERAQAESQKAEKTPA